MHHLIGHRLIHDQAHHRPELAFAQPLLDGLQQIPRFVLLDFHVSVAQNLKTKGVLDLVTGKSTPRFRR